MEQETQEQTNKFEVKSIIFFQSFQVRMFLL